MQSLFDASSSPVHVKRFDQHSKLIEAFMENKSVLPEGTIRGSRVVVACLFALRCRAETPTLTDFQVLVWFLKFKSLCRPQTIYTNSVGFQIKSNESLSVRQGGCPPPGRNPGTESRASHTVHA